MAESQAITYRRMVASLARELSAEEVKEVAYIRLTGKQRTSKYTSNNLTATGLDLLATIERLGVFSRQNAKGLVDIAEDINRYDLVEKVKDYLKEAKSDAKSTGENENKKTEETATFTQRRTKRARRDF